MKEKDETDCRICNYPHHPLNPPACCPASDTSSSRDTASYAEPKPLPAIPYKVSSHFEIANFGRVPIVAGDHNLLPERVKEFVVEQITVLRPASIVICNGTVFEEEEIRELLIKEGRLQRLSKHENVYGAQSLPADCATDGRVFLDQDFCHRHSDEKQCDGKYHTLGIPIVRQRARDELSGNLINSMRGRTMYVIPLSAGPIGCRFSINAVQLTDCPYTVLTTRLMMRVSSAVWDAIGTGDFVRCVHSVGAPRPVLSIATYAWPSNPTTSFVLVNTLNKKIISYGSAHFANSLVRSSLCLRIASEVGREQGWRAENAAIIVISDPSGEEMFACVQGAVGSGKSSLAMLQSTLPGWKVRTVSPTFAWLRWHTDGQLYAMSPENGFCVQWSYREDMQEKQPVEAQLIRKRALLLNVTESSTGDLQWVGRDEPVLPSAPSAETRSSLPPRAKSCAVVSAADLGDSLHPLWDAPAGVPISAYIFLSNRPSTVPVLQESPSWKEGITLALGTRTIQGKGIEQEKLVFNPFGMTSHYPLALNEYVKSWFDMEQEGRKMPKVFHLNLFRRPASCDKPAVSPVPTSPITLSSRSTTSLTNSDSSACFDRPISLPASPNATPKDFTTLWPGFGDNVRLLAWIHGRTLGKETAIGRPFPMGTIVPTGINTEGLGCVDWEACCAFDARGWRVELAEAGKKLNSIGRVYDKERAFITDFINKKKEAVKAAMMGGGGGGKKEGGEGGGGARVKEEEKKKREEEGTQTNGAAVGESKAPEPTPCQLPPEKKC